MAIDSNKMIYWTRMEHAGWGLYIAANSNGLMFVGSQDKPFEELTAWAKKRYPNCTLVQEDSKLKPYVSELTEYLQRKRTSFTIPFDLHGTPFQSAVWKALCAIPYGQTKSYSDIANYMGKPTAARAVGAAIGANPVLILVPCHRVIGKSGQLTGFRGGLEMKSQLLQLERHENENMKMEA